MNSKKFSEAMSELDSKYIDEALNYKKKARKPGWIKWGAVAACLCLIISSMYLLRPNDYNEAGNNGGIVMLLLRPKLLRCSLHDLFSSRLQRRIYIVQIPTKIYSMLAIWCKPNLMRI
ncbi:hypothetical protein M5E87_13175 [Flavonifractor plautii]|nr:hypothetical protein M5E87_13175 [Flavonifractor plautii]